MNREIKFRGKCSHCDAWAYGNLVDYGEGEAPEIHGFDPYREGDDVWREITVDADTVGQFTGMTDKNGVRIFEGDIVRIYDDDYEEYTDQQVKFAHGVFGVDSWTKKILTTLSFFMGCDSEYSVEVIGNIYDNFDLMK